MKPNCPKCGASANSNYRWFCGSSPNFDGTVSESAGCVKNRLKAETGKWESRLNDLKVSLAAECICGGGDGVDPPCVSCSVYHETVAKWEASDG